MLDKFLRVRKLAPFSRRDHSNPSTPANPGLEEHSSLALKIVHPGGNVECYYMAVPASRILDKHPSFVLAKPEVFRRPWDSVVRPEKILLPGQKFYLVPRHTVKKLRRKIRKPNKEMSNISFVSRASSDGSPQDGNKVNDDPSICSNSQYESSASSQVSGSFIRSAFRKKYCGVKKHVRFAGIDAKQQVGGRSFSTTSSSSDKKGNKAAAAESSHQKGLSSSSRFQVGGGKRRPCNVVGWEPSLMSINESQGN